jgi:hypothetical protein
MYNYFSFRVYLLCLGMLPTLLHGQDFVFQALSMIPNRALLNTGVNQATNVAPVVEEKLDWMAAQAPIHEFFQAIECGSATQMTRACAPSVSLKTHMQDQKGNHIFFDESIQDLASFATNVSGGQGLTVSIEYNLLEPEAGTTDVRVPYYFYINGQMSHCGVQSFSIQKMQDGWKIQQMVDTRSRTCVK